MPTLLQINVTANWGSTGKIADQIGLCAMSHNWNSYIAYGRMMNPSKNKLIKIGSIFDVYEHYVENYFFDNEGLASRQATKNFLKIVDNLKPDIVQLHNIHDHYLNYPLLFTYLATLDIPIIWTQHDCWAFTGGCMYYDLQNCDKWKTRCRSCPEHRALLCDITEKQFTLKRDLLSKINNITYVSVSDWLANSLRESHQKNRPIITIHNGVDISLFRPLRNKLNDGIFRIIGVASIWDKRKGLDDFVKLYSILPPKFEITLVGLTPKQIKTLPIGIRGVTRTESTQKLVELYSMADVFVNPTYSDNFPTTNIEALACGTPVITYRTGGSPEAVDEKTGIVVEQGDVRALADAICKMEKSPLSSEDCRQRAEKLFDKDKCFGQYIQLYDSLL